MLTGHRICNECREAKPATAEFFHRGTSITGGLQYTCRPCANKISVKYKPLLRAFYERAAKELGCSVREVRKIERSAFRKLRRSALAREIAGVTAHD